MKSTISKDRAGGSGWFIYFAVPFLVAVLLNLKVFLLPKCFSFDIIDGPVHTFANLAIAHEILRFGQIPMMNIFHNFGTPLLGDGFTLPFGIHSWTFAVLPGPWAFTVNRFVFAYLTVLLLTVYFRKIFPAAVSSLCALVAFFTPSAIWSIPSHHYQLAVPGACLMFLLQEKWMAEGSFRTYCLIYLAWVVLLLSINIQLPVLIAAFGFVHLFFLTGSEAGKKRFLFAAATMAAFALVFLDILSFFTHIAAQHVNFKYEMPMTPDRLWTLVLGGVKLVERSAYSVGRLNYHEVLVYLSIPLVTAVVMGTWRLWKDNKKRLFWKSSVLGILPTVLALFFLQFPQAYWSIPLVRSTDVTRFFWFSSIFLAIPVGEALEALRKGKWSPGEILAVGAGSLAFAAASFLFIPWSEIDLTYRLPLFAFALFIPAMTFVKTGSKKGEALQTA